MKHNNRRDFIKMAALSGASLGFAGSISKVYAGVPVIEPAKPVIITALGPDIPFAPNRVASWWCTLEDLLWSEKKITEKIKRRAAAFAEAKIDTAINFGFHIRFDFSNYFGQLHGYYANVANELHKYNIKFMDHYSCNNVERPRGEDEFKRLHRIQRHHVLLFHDPIAAQYAQYEGHMFRNLCQVDFRDGGRGYSPIYQFETFCHNNPEFLDMHKKYLQRLTAEVPFDGYQIDDMCDYAGLYTCGCKYCRDRFKRDYRHDIPPLTDKTFWGDVKGAFDGGNYENPAFRDWLRMRADSVADHVKMVKSVVGHKPLMTCVSSSGPARLNALTLNLERMSPNLDFFMLENVGLNVSSVDWVHMDAEALHQKDIAAKRGNSPAMAISYTIYEKGGYLGWSLSRFWGVANWSSTLNGRLEEDPADAMETEDIINFYNNWEVKHSNINYRDGQDIVEVRLVNSSFCRDNGWRDSSGLEQWDRVKAWSAQLLRNNVGYRFVRSAELADATALSREKTPLILDGIGCVSDAQFTAIKTYLAKGGTVWLALPFGTHNEKGFKRNVPLSEALLKDHYKNLIVIDTSAKGKPLQKLIGDGKFHPIIKQTGGDNRWAVRLRMYKQGPVMHFMNTAIAAVPHPMLKDASGVAILKDLDTKIKDNNLAYEIDSRKVQFPQLTLLSPEWNDDIRKVPTQKLAGGLLKLQVDLSGIKTYAVVQAV